MTETEPIPGIVCPDCGANNWRVLETRRGEKRIERRRQCATPECGKLIITRELFLRKVERRSTTGRETFENLPESM